MAKKGVFRLKNSLFSDAPIGFNGSRGMIQWTALFFRLILIRYLPFDKIIFTIC